MEKDTQSRKWQLTINNPVDKGFTHEKIKEIVSDMKSVVYWCMSDEIGENETYHTHVFIQGRGGIRFSSLKKKFEGAHFEMAKGSAEQNMEYVSKTGKWKNDKKAETSVPGTFEEFGEMPIERQGRRNDLDDLYAMIKDGYSDYDILEVMPESLLNLEKLDKVRQVLHQERYKNEFRNLEVVYLYGDTGVGKTRGIMEKYGYANVFRVTDYAHPFDNYRGQDVIVFEEFRSGFLMADMLNYLDGYPLELPCRYNNKFACYTKVYIITNVPLTQQYVNTQLDYPATWMAFLRRIKAVVHYTASGIHSQYIKIDKEGFYRMLDFDYNPFTS
ncbi:MAG: replication protein [Lachnoclostridium edouardi]|uniref:replication protein n=1 Tax=Lachnoclostridium edouardi TaxID=1926283 RepID=UPI0026DD85DF|nr:replication protein [Lachnoclostridium edouardi]MDO4279638.1 replication protein [Lachnoclostridium edouardi]